MMADTDAEYGLKDGEISFPDKGITSNNDSMLSDSTPRSDSSQNIVGMDAVESRGHGNSVSSFRSGQSSGFDASESFVNETIQPSSAVYHRDNQTGKMRQVPIVQSNLHYSEAQKPPPPTNYPPHPPSRSDTPNNLTQEDEHVIQKLDEEYDLALIEREIGWNARYFSVRQNAGLSLWFMFVFLLIGTIVFEINTDWDITEALLFSIYTITTVGYGSQDIPNTPSLLLFISVYIFLGIATLTIMAAQAYEWIILEVSRVQQMKDKEEFIKSHEQNMKNTYDLETMMNDELISPTGSNGSLSRHASKDEQEEEQTFGQIVKENMNKFIDFLTKYLQNNHVGQLVAVMLPFLFAILLGAMVVGVAEEWTMSESIYFAVASLTTVGYGDFYPTKFGSMWFCIFWLPLSIGFLSLYLSSVARFYIHISEQNVKRVESRLRRRLYLHRELQQREREEAMQRVASGGFGVANSERSVKLETIQDPPSHIKRSNGGNFDGLPTNDDPGFHPAPVPSDDRDKRRNEIHRNSGHNADGSSNMTMRTMKDVVEAVKSNMKSSMRSSLEQSALNNTNEETTPAMTENNLLSVQSTTHFTTARGIEKKPTFALRVLVQERLAGIVAHEIAGYQSNVSIKENTLNVTINTLKQTAEKWKLPRRATRAFRAVAFEALYYVGERDLIVYGPDAILKLSPSEVQSVFGPVLAAMGDSDTMEMWLSCTYDLARVELNPEKISQQSMRRTYSNHDEHLDDMDLNESQQTKFEQVKDRREAQLSANTTATPIKKRSVIGNAVNNQG